MKTVKIVKQFLRADSNAKCAEINVEAAIKIEESVICADLANNDINMNTDTPETDYFENNLGEAAEMSHPALWTFARTLERERDVLLALLASEKATRNHIIQKFETLAYWRDISECNCNDPLPNGGCLRCNLDRVFNTINQNEH